jgi:DNA sulfur modification protein DndB
MPDYVAAIKGQMGDWQYYVTVMKLGKIARECHLAEEIHPNKDLDELIQRAIGDRVEKEMVPYLLNERQRFYGALVVAVYKGDPDFSPVNVSEHALLDDRESSSYGFGLLRFDGGQTYYALDGQHRLKSIQEAIKLDPDLRDEQVTVIIIKHEDTRAGMERTRRLFSTLNRRAKPTSSGMNIAIDEDDSVAIVTRRLVKENPTMQKLVLAKASSIGSKQLQPSRSNDPYITTLAALYETNEILLGAYEGGLETGKGFK